MTARVLIVEDEPMIGRILAHKLSRDGHDVRWAQSAAEADAVVGDGGVDVAIVDATLERDGLSWAADLDGARRPRAGWLGMVEQRRPDEARRATLLGAAGIVVKPFKPTLVAAQVARLVEAAPA